MTLLIERLCINIDIKTCSIFGHKTNTCVPGTKPINGMYPACKFALTALTECLRQEVSYIEMGIKVTVSHVPSRNEAQQLPFQLENKRN